MADEELEQNPTPPVEDEEARLEDSKDSEEPAPKQDDAPTEEPELLSVDDLELPEGADKDDPLLAAFIEEAGKAGLDKQSAQSLLGLHQKALEAHYEQFNKTRLEWQAELKQEYGEGLTDELSRIATALTKFAPDQIDAFQQIMNTSGLGDNPVVFKVVSALANAALGGDLVKGESAHSGKPSIAERWFPKKGD